MPSKPQAEDDASASRRMLENLSGQQANKPAAQGSAAAAEMRSLFPSALDRIRAQEGQMPTPPPVQHESVRGQAFNALFDILGGNDEDPAKRAQATRRAENILGATRLVGDFTPVVGDALAFSDARQAYRQGNLGEAAILGAIGTVGMVPVVGDTAAAAARRVRSIGDNPLPGAPRTANIKNIGEVELGRNAQAELAALRAAELAGVPYKGVDKYLPIDVDRARRVAREYELMRHAPEDPTTRKAYDEMMRQTLAQYDAMIEAGITPYYIDAARNPYPNSPYEALLDISENNRVGVFPTVEGFGSNPQFNPAGNPLLLPSSRMIDGKPALNNDLFRAVHDYFGHSKSGVGFRGAGEEAAYQAHAGMFSPLARRALASETRGQNSWLNYGPYGDTNRTAKVEDTIFADQKVGLMPRWASEEGLIINEDRRREFFDNLARNGTGLEGAITDDGKLRLIHFSHTPLERIDPENYGRGLSARSRAERNRASDPDFINRSYYGIPASKNAYVPESGLGGVRNEVLIEPELIYQAQANPQGLWLPNDPTGSELRIAEAGYTGYYSTHPKLGKVAVVFDPYDVAKTYMIPLGAVGAGAAAITGEEEPEGMAAGGAVTSSRRMLDNLIGKKPEGQRVDASGLLGFANGGEASSSPTSQELLAQIDRSTASSPAPAYGTASSAPDREVTESRNMLRRLSDAFGQNVTAPVVGSMLDMTTGLGDLAQMGIKAGAGKLGIETKPFTPVSSSIQESLGVAGYDPYAPAALAASVLLPAAGPLRAAGAATRPMMSMAAPGSARETLSRLTPILDREASVAASAELAAMGARELAPDNFTAEIAAAIAGGGAYNTLDNILGSSSRGPTTSGIIKEAADVVEEVPSAARQMLDEVAPPAATEQIKQVEASAPTEKSPVPSYYMDEWTQETGLSPQEIEKFWRLGDNQRGLPEHLMVKAQRALGGGVLFPAIEHIGDLTNRMTPKHSLGFAYEETLGKAQRYLRSLKSGYGFRKEFEENLRNNAQFNNESLEEHRSKVNAALDAYADAHEKLVTYNPLQTLARDAAVSLGRRDFEKAATLLQDFVDRIPTREDFVAEMRFTPEPDLTKLSSRELRQKLQAIEEKRRARQGLEGSAPTPAVPTQTPEFKNFFGGSKVTDAGGQPLVVYHGTGSDFTAFRPSESGLLGRGIYLSSEKRVAEGFRGADKLMPIYASMKNPAYEHDLIPKKVGNKMKGDEYEKELHDRAIDGGFDGIIKGSSTDVFGNPRTPDSWGNFVVFEPTQIKSATDNVGTFDPTTPVITKAKGGLATKSNVERVSNDNRRYL